MIETYQQRLRALREDGDGSGDERESIAADRALRLAGIRAERVELIRLHHADEINDVVFHELLYELDVRESSLVPALASIEHRGIAASRRVQYRPAINSDPPDRSPP